MSYSIDTYLEFAFLILFIFLLATFLYYLFVELKHIKLKTKVENRPKIPIFNFLSEIMISTGKSFQDRMMYYIYFYNSYSRIVFLMTSILSLLFLIFANLYDL